MPETKDIQGPLHQSYENTENEIGKTNEKSMIDDICKTLLKLFGVKLTTDDVKDLTLEEKSAATNLYQELNNKESSYKQFQLLQDHLGKIFLMISPKPREFTTENKDKEDLLDRIKFCLKDYIEQGYKGNKHHKNITNTTYSIKESCKIFYFECNIRKNISDKNLNIIQSGARIDKYGNLYKLERFGSDHDLIAERIIRADPSLRNEYLKFGRANDWRVLVESDFLISKGFVKLSPQLQSDERLKNITIPCYLAYTTLSNDQKNKIFDLTGQWIN